jgi:branched-chain amino acid transport system ATP-binding protein
MSVPILQFNNVEAVYDNAIQALRGLSLVVPENSIVALLGSNGAGKTTALKAISGFLPLENGKVSSGSIKFQGEDIASIAPHVLVQRGIFHVREGRHVFAEMNVDENLVAATYALKGRSAGQRAFDEVYSYFPSLARRRKIHAGYLSGGEQQMLALGRALIAEPKLILLDEPSLGLAPLVVSEIFEIIAKINRDKKVAMLLVEQNATVALRYASYGYVMENGRVVIDGAAPDLAANPVVQEFYLGIAPEGSEKKSFRNVKNYRRDKAWMS